MVDNCGRKVRGWLPHMQSSAFLQASISRGERTAECWEELTARSRRVRAAREIIAQMKLRQALAGVAST